MVRDYKRKTKDLWSNEDLLEALQRIKNANMTVSEASLQFGISRATLYRKYKKFILGGATSDLNQFRTNQGNPILSKVEEDVFEKTVKELREQGNTFTSVDIKRMCFEYCEATGIPNRFNQEKRIASDDWLYGFLKRHPNAKMPKRVSGTLYVTKTDKPPTPKTKKPQKRSATVDQDQEGVSSKRTKKVQNGGGNAEEYENSDVEEPKEQMPTAEEVETAATASKDDGEEESDRIVTVTTTTTMGIQMVEPLLLSKQKITKKTD